jgi:hypothetical protein
VLFLNVSIPDCAWKSIHIILLDQANIVYQFLPIHSTLIPVFAGLAPLDTGFASAIPTTVVCMYFSAFVSSLLGVSQFVAAKPPVYCVENCTSVFLPGGLEIDRALGGNLNQTLLGGNDFGNSDTVLVNKAPGIGLEFWPPDDGFHFARENDCKTYVGYNLTAGDAIQLCITYYESYLAVGKYCTDHSLCSTLKYPRLDSVSFCYSQ